MSKPKAVKEVFNKDCFLFQEMRKILNKHDVMQIAYVNDEYDPEIIDIINRCECIRSEVEVRDCIANIFLYWFGGNYCEMYDKCKELSKEVYHLFRTIE